MVGKFMFVASLGWFSRTFSSLLGLFNKSQGSSIRLGHVVAPVILLGLRFDGRFAHQAVSTDTPERSPTGARSVVAW